MDLAKLIVILQEADKMYYEMDRPTMTDEAYDALCNDYKSITGLEWHEDKVPGVASDIFAPVEHPSLVKSLEKVNTRDELLKELKRLSPGVCQMKYDGLTLVAYPGGIIATRGNGKIGEEVSHTAGFLFKGKKPCRLPIRGEAFILKSDFKKINELREANGEEPYKNLRNAAAGMIRNKEADGVVGLPFLKFVAYNILGSSLTEDEQLAELKILGYDTPGDYGNLFHFFTHGNIPEVADLIMNVDRDALDFEIDGMVIKSNLKNAIEHFGETGHHYKNAVAYKFPSQGVWTKLKHIRWTVGRTGKVVPNADIEPVELLNTTVRKASIHNASMLGRKNLCEGCEVYVVKANDIIPDIQDVRGGDPTKPIKPIEQCPKCGTNLVRVFNKDDVRIYQHYCVNPDCSSLTVLRVVHMAQRDALDIDGLAEKTVQKMYDDCLIDSPYDVFKVTIDEIEELEGFARPSAVKLYNNIQKARKADFARFLYAAGIPMIGKSKSEDISKWFDTYEDLILDISTGCKRVSDIPGIGKELMNNITHYWNMWSQLKTVVEPVYPKKAKKADKELTFVVTGTLSQPRKYYEDIIKGAGHKVSGSVSKKTDYVVVGKDPGSKYERAVELQIPILSEDELTGVI